MPAAGHAAFFLRSSIESLASHRCAYQLQSNAATYTQDIISVADSSLRHLALALTMFCFGLFSVLLYPYFGVGQHEINYTI